MQLWGRRSYAGKFAGTTSRRTLQIGQLFTEEISNQEDDRFVKLRVLLQANHFLRQLSNFLSARQTENCTRIVEVKSE